MATWLPNISLPNSSVLNRVQKHLLVRFDRDERRVPLAMGSCNSPTNSDGNFSMRTFIYYGYDGRSVWFEGIY